MLFATSFTYQIKFKGSLCFINMNFCRTCSGRFSDQGGLFDVVVRPMLQQGHEGELCSWLKEMSLIRTASNCPHVNCTGRSLIWSPARIVDKYIWSCPDCARKQSIRENSIFFGIKCDLKMCLQLILGWCQKIPYEVAASYLGFCLYKYFYMTWIIYTII